MSKIRNDVSKRNPYWISRHRYLELLHLCAQYKELAAERLALLDTIVRAAGTSEPLDGTPAGNQTETLGIRAAEISRKLDAIKGTADKVGGSRAGKLILISVTEGLSYDEIQAQKGELLPLSRGTFYKLRRRFFWMLSKEV